MNEYTISERRHHNAAAVAVWTLIGVFALVAFGDVVMLAALGAAAVATAVWTYRRVGHRPVRDHSGIAAVMPLQLASARRSDPRDPAAQLPLHGPRAA